METAMIILMILGVISGLSHGSGVLPDSLHATLGGKVIFTTTVTPAQKPFLVVTWSIANSHGAVNNIITSSTENITAPEYESRITLFRSTGSLELRDLRLGDSGEYSVMILSDGTAMKKGICKLEIYVSVSNVVVTPSSTSLVEFVSSVSLSCSSSGSSLSFVWLNGSSKVTAGEGVQITDADGGSTLIITRVTRYDQGPFSCHVLNPVSNDTSKPVQLSISFGPENVVLATSPVQEYYDEGSDISLSCSALSNPPAQFYWLLNETLLSNTGPELRLENIQRKQSGAYSCGAYNNKTVNYQTSKPAVVTVLKATISNVVLTPSSTDLVEFSSLSLSCSSSGSSINFRWLNGSSEVTANKSVQITNGGSNLTIINVTRYDQGPFRCYVFNLFSNGTSNPVVFSINYGPDDIHLKASPSQDFDEGSDIILKCSAVSKPPAFFQWFLNGVLLSDTGPEFRLENIQKNQSGAYSCRAYNNKTMRYLTSQPAVIKVQVPVSGVVVTPSNADLMEFSSVNLSCSSSGSSLSFHWLNGTSEVTASDRVQLTNGGSTLTITNVTRYDQGPFRCNASNAVSVGLSRPFNLVVQYGPDSLTILAPNSTHAGDFTMLCCAAASVPTATVTWLFKGSPTSVHGAVYIIQASSSSDQGRYTCTAANAVTGLSGTVHYDLSVTALPAGDCSAIALKAAAATAGCCIIIAVVAVMIVFCMIRGKRSTSKYAAHAKEKQSVRKKPSDLQMYKSTGTARLSSLNSQPDSTSFVTSF